MTKDMPRDIWVTTRNNPYYNGVWFDVEPADETLTQYIKRSEAIPKDELLEMLRAEKIEWHHNFENKKPHEIYNEALDAVTAKIREM